MGLFRKKGEPVKGTVARFTPPTARVEVGKVTAPAPATPQATPEAALAAAQARHADAQAIAAAAGARVSAARKEVEKLTAEIAAADFEGTSQHFDLAMRRAGAQAKLEALAARAATAEGAAQAATRELAAAHRAAREAAFEAMKKRAASLDAEMSTTAETFVAEALGRLQVMANLRAEGEALARELEAEAEAASIAALERAEKIVERAAVDHLAAIERAAAKGLDVPGIAPGG